MDWRKPIIGVLAAFMALGDVSASTASITGGMWLSIYVACATAIAVLALPTTDLLKNIGNFFIGDPFLGRSFESGRCQDSAFMLPGYRGFPLVVQ